MEFSVRGIGIIKEADIKMDGLTVISGNNNSGKTTVGRTLYSVVNALENLEEKRDVEQASEIVEKIIEIVDLYKVLLENYQMVLAENRGKMTEFVRDIILLKYDDAKKIKENFEYYTTLLYKFCSSIENDEFLGWLIEDIEKASPNVVDKKMFYNEWKKYKDKALLECDKVCEFVKLLQSQERKVFACKIIEKFLQVEFENQIQSIIRTDEEKYSNIRLHTGEKDLFELYIFDDKIDIEKSKFENGYFEKVYFVDDPYILEDQLSLMHMLYQNDDLTQKGAANHRKEMRWSMQTLEEDKKISETLYQEKQLKNVMKQINEIVPGMVSGGTYYTSEMKIKIGNLATGFKIFSIIKKILTENDLSDKTLLILDEPESHLHPEWINRLAEVIVLLVKECNITVLLTTHSPNFLLAVDALMRKYDIRDKCHFYQTEQEEDHRVKYIERTDSLDDVYADFAASFAKMSAIRKKYINLED